MTRDQSAGGIGVEVARNINAGVIIAIMQGSSRKFGVVRHSTKEGKQFLIGIEYCEVESATTVSASNCDIADFVTPEDEALLEPATGTATITATAENNQTAPGEAAGLFGTGGLIVEPKPVSAPKPRRSWD